MKQKIKRLWIAFGVILLGTLVLEFGVHMHVHFGFEDWSFFYAWYGFLSCVVIVLGSKLLGFILKRPEDYYKIEGKGETHE